jgi:hypothetical protein
MEQLLTAVIVAPFVITMVGFAVAIAFAPAVPNEIAPATGHDHDSRQLHRAKPRRWHGRGRRFNPYSANIAQLFQRGRCDGL